MSEDLAARVNKLEAIEEIRNLLSDYAFHLDMNETEALAQLFTEDCSVIYGPGFGAGGH